MNFQNDQEQELRRREQELQARERAIRLRELEAEINESSLYSTVKPQESESPLKQRYRTLVKVGQFSAIVVVVVVSIKIAAWLTNLIILGAVAWVGYKLIFDRDRFKK